MIEDAEEKGLITPGITTLLEPTSGNLGISLAYIALRKGYKFIAVMQAHFPLEKMILLRHLGAEVLITGEKEFYYSFLLNMISSLSSYFAFSGKIYVYRIFN